MEEGMREGARQQRTIEARERPTNEAGNEGGKEQHAAAFSDDDGSERSRSVAVASRLVPLPYPSLPRQCATEEGRREEKGWGRRTSHPARIAQSKMRRKIISRRCGGAAAPRVLDRRTPSQSPPQLNHNTCVVRRAEREWMHDAARARQNARRATDGSL